MSIKNNNVTKGIERRVKRLHVTRLDLSGWRRCYSRHVKSASTTCYFALMTRLKYPLLDYEVDSQSTFSLSSRVYVVRVEREMQPAAMVCSTAGLLVVGLLTAGLRMAAPRLSAISCGVGEASRAHPPPSLPFRGGGVRYQSVCSAVNLTACLVIQAP